MDSAQVQVCSSRPRPIAPPPTYGAGATRRIRALQGLGRKLDAQDPRAAREAAALLTSQLFFGPLLAEMRKLPFGKEIGQGGRAEEVFGEQLDTLFADVVARSDQSLTGSLADRLTRGAREVAAERLAAQRAVWPAQMQARRTAEALEAGPGEPEAHQQVAGHK